MTQTPLFSKTALIMAAGTGGHVIPGIAIAHALTQKAWAVQWLGTRHGMENTLVPAAGIKLHGLPFAGLRGKGLVGFVKGAIMLCVAVCKAFFILRALKPAVVVGMGGYVCVPGAWAAKLLGIPLVLVNADAQLLLSNKTLAKQARVVCCGFNGSASQLPNAVVTGNPVREAIAMIAEPEQRYAQRTGPLHLLIVGGSLGAHVLNTVVPKAIALLPESQRPVITHQTGSKDVQFVLEQYQSQGMSASVVPFIHDMASAYAQADVLVCRAGAITVSELCAAGVPAILVPLLAKTTQHQAGNAQYLQNMGAAIHMPQAALTPEYLATQLADLNRDRLLAMALKAKALAQLQATEHVIQQIEKASI